MKRAVVPVLGWLLLCSACNSTFRDAMARAEQARKSGDVPSEARSLRQACHADPDEQEVCQRAAQLEEQVVRAQLLQFEQARAAEDVNGALAALDIAYSVNPQRAELAQAYAAAGDLHLKLCRARQVLLPE